MLVLARDKDESVILTVPGRADRIKITVMDVRGNRTRLGFEASTDIAINREETQVKIDRERDRDNGGPQP